jgi:hypothetical protein
LENPKRGIKELKESEDKEASDEEEDEYEKEDEEASEEEEDEDEVEEEEATDRRISKA